MKNLIKKSVIYLIAALIALAGYFSELNEANKQIEDIGVKKAGNIRVHFLDVGQGDCTLIELPDDKIMLIDAGNKENGDDIVSYIKMLGKDKIDYLIATHPHSDHIGGMERVVNKFDIGNVYMPKAIHNISIYKDLLKAIDNKGLYITTAKAGVEIYSDDITKIEILSPTRETYEEMNNYSAVIRLTYKNSSFLFMGDAEELVEDDIINKVQKTDVLKVGHHGSTTSSSRRFINRVNPDYAIISCGVDNDYGHPHAETLSILKNSTVLRTDELGTIIITSDGETITYE